MRELLLLTLALAAAACSTAGPLPPPRQADPSVAALPLPTPRPGEAKARPQAPVPVPRPDRPSVQPFDLEQLGGATESAVIAMIGKPDEIREQPPGMVWVYSQGTCRVEVHLYPSVDVGSMAVLGTALVPGDMANGDRDRCRRSLARRTARAQ